MMLDHRILAACLSLIGCMASPLHAQVIPGCHRDADEATRVETARSILKVNARVDPLTGVEDVDHYHRVINFWAERGSGEDGVGEDGAVYQESILSNFTRQEMWDYLDVVFDWSPDMELRVLDEIWETHPDDSMTYMVVNLWFGNTGNGYYEQPGISVVKFRPGEGCAAYQRDYFSEGDTWWGMSFAQPGVRDKRETVLRELELTGRCVDDDGDGFPKYAASLGCSHAALDCNDYSADINPGAEEILDNGIDDNCDGVTDG
jgi:Putative metal-binding motif